MVDDHRKRVRDLTAISRALMHDVCQKLFVLCPETPVPGPYSHKFVNSVEAEEGRTYVKLNLSTSMHACILFGAVTLFHVAQPHAFELNQSWSVAAKMVGERRRIYAIRGGFETRLQDMRKWCSHSQPFTLHLTCTTRSYCSHPLRLVAGKQLRRGAKERTEPETRLFFFSP